MISLWICVGMVLFLIMMYVFMIFLCNGTQKKGEPPLLRGFIPFLGCALSFGYHPGQFLLKCSRKYGDIFTLFIAGQRMTFLMNPHDCETLVSSHEAYSFREITDEIGPKIFGYFQDEMSFEPEFLYRTASEGLKGSSLASLTESMQQEIHSYLQYKESTEWQTSQLFEFTSKSLHDCVCNALFGSSSEFQDSYSSFAMFDHHFPLLAAGVPGQFLRGYGKAMKVLRQQFSCKRMSPSALVQTRDVGIKNKVSARDRASLQISLLWAAQANSSPAAFWSLFYILRDPIVRKKVQHEVDELLEGKDLSSFQSFSPILRKMFVLNSAICESLRLSSASMTIRKVMPKGQSFSLQNGQIYQLRVGDRLLFYPYLLHRDPDLYPSPQTFQFDRFLHPQKKNWSKNEKPVKYAFMPFGAGVSKCPGRFFAINEIKLFVVMMMCQFDIELLEANPPELDQTRAGIGVLPPKRDILFRYRSK